MPTVIQITFYICKYYKYDANFHSNIGTFFTCTCLFIFPPVSVKFCNGENDRDFQEGVHAGLWPSATVYQCSRGGEGTKGCGRLPRYRALCLSQRSQKQGNHTWVTFFMAELAEPVGNFSLAQWLSCRLMYTVRSCS